MLSKNISSIRISGLLGLALATACGGDEEPAAKPPVNGGFEAGVTTTPEAGTGLDAGAPGGDAGQCMNTQLGSGVLCTLAGGTPGYRRCVNGVVMGECMSFLSGVDIDAAVNAIRDSGLLADTGLIFSDGSVSWGDATITLPEAGTLKCGTGYMCSSTLGAFFPGISACVKEGGDGLFPDSCTTPMGTCMAGGKTGTCQNVLIGNFCIVPCN